MQLGNDIVDLKIDAEIHPRFLDRILHPEERLLYPNIEENPRLIWTLWAAKESAYKACCQSSKRFFVPNRWLVKLEEGRVQFATQSWMLKLGSNADAVWASCASSDFPIVELHRSSTNELSPRDQREWIRSALSELLAVYAANASFHKDATAVPRLTHNGHYYPFSMSHHGRHIYICLGLQAQALSSLAVTSDPVGLSLVPSLKF